MPLPSVIHICTVCHMRGFREDVGVRTPHPEKLFNHIVKLAKISLNTISTLTSPLSMEKLKLSWSTHVPLVHKRPVNICIQNVLITIIDKNDKLHSAECQIRRFNFMGHVY